MARHSPGLMPFGDKNAMLVIVFLVLSLGIGSLRNQQQVDPASSLHPALVTINQETQGFLGVEKLVFMEVGSDYFVDEALSLPSGLDEHSLSDATDFVGRGVVGNAYRDFANEIALRPGSTFHSANATRDNTEIASFQIIDRSFRLEGCMNAMVARSPTVTSNGQCVPISNLPGGDSTWSKIRSLAAVEDFRCFRNTCSYGRDGFDLSFSGVGTEAWNGVSLSYQSRSAFKSETVATGVLCYFDPNVQREILDELRQLKRSSSNFVAFGLNSFLLFQGETGFAYMKDRIASNATTSLLASAFDPNKSESVSQVSLHFDGVRMNGAIQDGIVFPDLEACEATLQFSEAHENFSLGNQPREYTSEILRLFRISISAGKFSPLFGVDRIERR